MPTRNSRQARAQSKCRSRSNAVQVSSVARVKHKGISSAVQVWSMYSNVAHVKFNCSPSVRQGYWKCISNAIQVCSGCVPTSARFGCGSGADQVYFGCGSKCGPAAAIGIIVQPMSRASRLKCRLGVAQV
eukprot:7075075-Pyramimonas_sp.AAC.1